MTLPALTGPQAADLLAAALGSSDQELVTWRVRQVDHRPGTGSTVAYDVRLRGERGEHRQVLVAGTELCTPSAGPPPLLLPHAGEQVAVWRFPLDPALPALATAVDEESVRGLLTSHGVAPGPLRLDVRSYRPRRRAVVEVQAPARRLFLKVLPPAAVAGLHERHRLLVAAGLPVPRSLGWSEQGLLVLTALPGTTLRARLRQGGSPVPDVAALTALLDRLPEQLCALPLRPSWTDEVTHFADVVAAALPEEAARCAQLAARISARTAGRPADVPSHGDVYDAQLLLDGGRISGLLDVDAAGPGRRADDLACLLAHVAVLAQAEPEHRGTSRALLSRWRSDAERAVEPRELRARVAGVVLTLASGPYRVQQQDWPGATRLRLDLAEQWLAARGAAGWD